MFLKLEKRQLMGLSSWLDEKSKLGRWTMAMNIYLEYGIYWQNHGNYEREEKSTDYLFRRTNTHPDISFRRKRWNSREARFKMTVTEYFLELKDKYLQMENTLWVLEKIKKKCPLDTSRKNWWTLKVYKKH